MCPSNMTERLNEDEGKKGQSLLWFRGCAC